MSWLFSQVLVEEYLGGNCLDGKPSVPSNSMPTVAAYLCGDKTKEISRLSRFGMTLQPLTADRGEALLTSFRADFLAKTFQQPEEAQESTENVQASGVRWRELFLKFDQDLSSWRTHRCLFQEDLPESSLTLPRWGLMQNGELSERTTPQHLTSETESGCWPTPSANNYEQTDVDKLLERRERIKSQGINGNGFGLTLANAVQIEERKTWATPRTSDYKSCGPVGSKSHHHMTEKQYLCAQVKEEDQPTGHLNPTWVEWLMGWPIGWTDSKPLETDRFQQWWNSHGKHSEALD